MKKKKYQAFGVVGICLNHQGQVLVTQRHEPQRPNIHHKWQFPGGGIEFGETPTETIKRELLEEIGCQVKIISLIPYLGSHVYHHPKSQAHIVLMGYLVKITSGKPHPTHYEIAAVKWVKPQDIDFSQFLPLSQEFLQAAQLPKK